MLKLRVVDPDRPAHLEPREGELLPVARHEVQARLRHARSARRAPAAAPRRAGPRPRACGRSCFSWCEEGGIHRAEAVLVLGCHELSLPRSPSALKVDEWPAEYRTVSLPLGGISSIVRSWATKGTSRRARREREQVLMEAASALAAFARTREAVEEIAVHAVMAMVPSTPGARARRSFGATERTMTVVAAAGDRADAILGHRRGVRPGGERATAPRRGHQRHPHNLRSSAPPAAARPS